MELLCPVQKHRHSASFLSEIHRNTKTESHALSRFSYFVLVAKGLECFEDKSLDRVTGSGQDDLAKMALKPYVIVLQKPPSTCLGPPEKKTVAKKLDDPPR